MAESVESKIKAWLTPGLITCFGMISWSVINEIRSDIKALLSANAQVQVKVQSLERRMDGAEAVIYSQRMFAIKPDDIEIKEEKKN